MSSMRDLLEKMEPFAGEKVGQKPGDQVRGSEPVPRKGGYKKHPYDGRLVGAAESTESILKDLNKVLNENPVRRDLFQEWKDFKTLNEYGAPGSAISGKQQGQDPVERSQMMQQQQAQKNEIQNQINELLAVVAGARSQFSQLNKAFPQGANPVEKAMALKDMQAQKVALTRQIEDAMQQIAALRRQIL